MRCAIGIDIGGTKIALVVGTSGGAILARREIPTGTGPRSLSCIRKMTAELKALIAGTRISRKRISGIGVCCPGAVNALRGIVPRSPNLPGWEGIPLRKILSKAGGLPVFLANDANAAALGESLFGAGKNVKNFIYITISTGIGGGIIFNGRLYAGTGFVAGEIGHMSVVPDGKPCNCGQRGCLEAYASGTAIARFVRSRMGRERTRIREFLFGDQKITARQVGMAAGKGDRLSIESYRQAGYYLGIGIANLLNILNPERIVIGGGVLRSAHKIFWRTMLDSAKRQAWPEAFRTVKIVRSRVRGSVGDFGALALVFTNTGGRP